MAVLVVCIGTAWLSSLVGLSLALGAFLAGIVIAGSPVSQRATDRRPATLRDLFASLFFLSLGMLFDFARVAGAPRDCSGAGLRRPSCRQGCDCRDGRPGHALPGARRHSSAALAWRSSRKWALCWPNSAAGCQQCAHLAGAQQVLFAAGILTMFVTPLTMAFAPSFTAGAALLRPLERLLGARGIAQQTEREENLKDHVIIGGLLACRSPARAATDSRATLPT